MKLNSHPVTFARLADLVEGRLTADERGEVQAHVGACARCSAQVAQLEAVTGLMRTDASVDAPRDVLAAAVSLFASRREADAAGRSPSVVRRLLATLTFDSARVAPAFGVRSGHGADAARQLIFSAGASDIDLRLARVAEGWAVSGQVLGECAGGSVEIEGAGETAARFEVALSELCEFSLPPVSDGSYKLLLRLPGAEVQIPELDLRA